MYKRILLPTDGSTLSRQATAAGIQFAKEHNAEIVGVHVIPVLHDDQLEAWMHHDAHLVERRQALFDKFADEYLAFVTARAQAVQVPVRVEKVRAAEASIGILKAADDAQCDLVFMASHGWRKGEASMLGSETLKVLHLSKVPVLVFKPG